MRGILSDRIYQFHTYELRRTNLQCSHSVLTVHDLDLLAVTCDLCVIVVPGHQGSGFTTQATGQGRCLSSLHCEGGQRLLDDGRNLHTKVRGHKGLRLERKTQREVIRYKNAFHYSSILTLELLSLVIR